MIELVTVMIVIGILAASAVARFDGAMYRERGFHDSLKAALQFARKVAVAKRRQVCVDVAGLGDMGAGAVSFTIVSATPETGVAACPAATNLNLAGGSANAITTPSGVSLTAAAVIYFDALGRPSATSSFSSTGQPDIVVEAETGYVH